jgi:NADPH:quinone reductase-like Zn-dependent oxidoreductase
MAHTRLRVYQKAADAAALPQAIHVEDPAAITPGTGQVLIQVRYAGVNPSDVKAVLGAMPHAIWPRTPGRDYAGVVVAGPPTPATCCWTRRMRGRSRPR